MTEKKENINYVKTAHGMETKATRQAYHCFHGNHDNNVTIIAMVTQRFICQT